MIPLHYVTTNPGKVNSLTSILQNFGIEVIHVNKGLLEIQHHEVEDIAKFKVRQALDMVNGPVVAMDSGLCMTDLDGWPGSYTSPVLDRPGIEKFMRMIAHFDTSCYFLNCLAYLDRALEQPELFIDEVPGRLILEPKGTRRPYFWSDLFFYFVPKGETKTLAEMAPEEYFKWREERYSKDTYISQFARWFLARNA